MSGERILFVQKKGGFMKFTFNDRTEIAKDYKWNLESLYENEELLEKDMKEFESGLSELREYRENLWIALRHFTLI